LTGIINFEILYIPTYLGLTESFGYFIYRGLSVSLKRYLRHAASCVSSGKTLFFVLHAAVLLGLMVTPCEAAAETSAYDHRISYGLKKEYTKIGETTWQNRPHPSNSPMEVSKNLSFCYDIGNNYGSLFNLCNVVYATKGLTPSEYPIKDEYPTGEDGKPDDTKAAVEPITRAVPIWGEKVRAMGYELPLPFGAGINLVYMDQGIEIRNLKIGFGDPSQKIERVTFSNASAKDKAATARLDMWLLPFANIYGILGYIDGEAELDVNLPGITIDVPGIGPTPILDPATLNFDIDYTGNTFGGGITLAGGYKNFFGSLDANYTYSNIDLVDGDIKTLTISPRLGVLVDPAVIKGSFAFWIGAMYMDYKQTVTDSVNLKELDPTLPAEDLEFEIDIKNEEPWNFLMGGQWEVTKRWQMMVEGGVGNRLQIIFGTLFRF